MNDQNISMRPIGLIHTAFEKTDGMPIQSARSEAPGSVEVYPDFEQGLEGVEEFSHLILLYVWHRSPETVHMLVKPFLDETPHGVFATRFPNRPNQIGLSVVRLVERRENILEIRGADMLDGTPLLDIKPYVPDFDIFEATRIGWYGHRAHP